MKPFRPERLQRSRLRPDLLAPLSRRAIRHRRHPARRRSRRARRASCWWSRNISAASAPPPTCRRPNRASISPRRSTIRPPTCRRTASAPASTRCAPTSQLQNEKQRLIVARTQLETSLFGLARLLNLDPRAPIELADQVSFFERPAVSADADLERAYTARPELRQILSREQRATLELQQRRRSAPAALSIGPLDGAGAHAHQRHPGVPISGQSRFSALHRRTDSGASARKPISRCGS